MEIKEKEYRYAEKTEQITFSFEDKSNEIENELKKLDVLNITPMDAMNILYNLQKKLK